MRTATQSVPTARLAKVTERDVATDEKAMIDRIAELRLKETSSLEAIGYLIGADPAQLSRYLKGTRGTTLTNYQRIA